MSAAARPDVLLPQPPGGMAGGALLALAAHGLLLAALTTVMQWRATPPSAVTAELWSALPQVAAPPPAPAPVATPAPPPPAPPARPQAEPSLPDPQIAIAREKAEREKAAREREEQQRAEKLRREQAERDRKERELEAKRREQAERDRKAAEEKRIAELRQKNLERLMGQVGTTAGSTGSAAQEAGPSKSYAGKLVATIKPNIVFTETIAGNPAAEVEVRAGPSGSIISRRLVRSSGNKDWDEAVLRAIDRTGSLPRDVDGRVPPTIIVAFRPQE